eukprot:69638_1
MLSTVDFVSLSIFIITGLLLIFMIILETKLFISLKELHARVFNSLSMTIYLSYILQMITTALMTTNTPNGESICKYIISINIVFYFIGRATYYTIFIVRLHIIFKSSPTLQYPMKLLLTLFIIVIVFSLSIGAAFVYDHKTNAYYDHKTHKCIPSISLILTSIVILFDLIMSILTLYLFIKKLQLLINNCDSMVKSLQFIILKHTVLVMVSVLSTFCILSVHGFVITIGVWAMVNIDWVLNSICIAFMKQYYDKYYNILCFYPDKCVRFCCAKKHKYQNDVMQLKKEVNSNSTNNENTIKVSKKTENVTVETIQSTAKDVHVSHATEHNNVV